VGELVTIAFFFLLRVCEYAKVSGKRLTQPLRKQNVRLWIGDRLVDPDAAWEMLSQATSVTICLVIHKNGTKDTTLHHGATDDPAFGPVRAMARRLHALRGAPPALSSPRWMPPPLSMSWTLTSAMPCIGPQRPPTW
jgi:hypothetical protein